MKWIASALLAIVSFVSWTGEKITRSESEWREHLGYERYRVMREKGTERAFLGKYLYFDKKGFYHCAACELPLFSSESKYPSPSGWPTFKEPAASKNVYYLPDPEFRNFRYEILCARCDSHLGHLFHDGPPPKNFRYTLNSIALSFHETLNSGILKRE